MLSKAANLPHPAPVPPGAVTLTDVKMARETVADIIHHTPLVTSRSLGARFGIELFFKAECLQKTGSFKPRGAAHKLRSLAGQRVDGVITVSSGNHGQAVAYVAGMLGMPAVILVPEQTPPGKVRAARSYGAEVIVGGDLNQVDTMIAGALDLARARNLGVVHPFDDPLTIAGQGTCGLEILDDLRDVDVIIVPVGGGGLIAGIAAAVKAVKPSVQIIGVGPDRACSMFRSFVQRQNVRLTDMPRTIADGIRTPMVGSVTLPLVLDYVDDVVTVDDDAIREALTDIWGRVKLVVEPAGAVGYAALVSRQIAVRPGSKVVIVLSGGNVDLDGTSALLS